jgi:hypothetical protein
MVGGRASMQPVPRAADVSPSTAQWWCQRARDRFLDSIEAIACLPAAGSIGPTRLSRTSCSSSRRGPKEASDLGEYGARAIHRELVAREHAEVGADHRPDPGEARVLDAGRRIRHPPPPHGWYPPCAPLTGGVEQVTNSLGGALGAWIAGRLFDLTASYALALPIAAAMALLAPGLLWFVAPRRPNPPPLG